MNNKSGVYIMEDRFKYTDILKEFNRLYKQQSIDKKDYEQYRDRALDFYNRQDHQDAAHDTELKSSIKVKIWLLSKKVET